MEAERGKKKIFVSKREGTTYSMLTKPIYFASMGDVCIRMNYGGRRPGFGNDNVHMIDSVLNQAICSSVALGSKAQIFKFKIGGRGSFALPMHDFDLISKVSFVVPFPPPATAIPSIWNCTARPQSPSKPSLFHRSLEYRANEPRAKRGGSRLLRERERTAKW